MSSTASRWREARPQWDSIPWGAIAYHAMLPAVVACLPVLLPLLAVWDARWLGTPAGLQLLPLLVLLVAAVWARQVMLAADDDLGSRADQGLLDPKLARSISQAMQLAVWVLVIGLPLLYPAAANRHEAKAFHAHSGDLLNLLDERLASEGVDWVEEYGSAKEFDLEDPRLDPALVTGPFAPVPDSELGRLVFDDTGHLFYLIDRPTLPAPAALAYLTSLMQQIRMARQSDTADWLYERGLVLLGHDGRPPETTANGHWPLLRWVKLNHRWAWYTAGGPPEPAAAEPE